jgi:integrase
MTIDEYLASLRASTASEYRTTYKHLDRWNIQRLDGKPLNSFSDFLRQNFPTMSENTIVKHVRQARTISKKCKLNLDIDVITPVYIPPPKFSDNDFHKLVAGFADCPYPKFIVSTQRHRYWETLIHFVAVTALRRQAVLGMRICDVNFDQSFVSVRPEIDKKGKERYKPITPELASDLIELLRHYDSSGVPAKCLDCLFPWGHGDRVWYECWRAAEKKVGKRFHLHDVKRFSGELALRAGATPLELMQHMDHSDIKTTLQHYCRPTTTALIRKLKVPLPDRPTRMTPMFTEPELEGIVERMVRERLAVLGIDSSDIGVDEYGAAFIKNSDGTGNLNRQRRKTDQRTFQKSARELAKEAKAKAYGFRVFFGEEGGDV